jgi:hypothetical protein
MRSRSAGPGDALHEPAPQRIAREEDEGDRPGRLLGGEGHRDADRHDDVDVETHQLGRELGPALELPVGPSVLDRQIPSLDVAEVPHPLPESLVQVAGPGAGREVPDPRGFPRRRLRRGEWRGKDTEGEGERQADGAASHG